MFDYSKIQNERLRQLVIDSESIHSLPEAGVQTVIDAMAALPPDGVQEAIITLEEEQKNIAAAKQAQGITPEMEMKEIEENSQQLAAIKHEHDTSVRKIQEEKIQGDDEKSADDILDTLNKIP